MVTNAETLNKNSEEFIGNAWEYAFPTARNKLGIDSTEATESVNYPPTDSFWWIKLSKKGKYNNIPGSPTRLKRTAKRCGTNPTYENSLVMTINGRTKKIKHTETYYTDKDLYANWKPKFPVSNIEWRIRSILNDDRKRKNLGEMPNSWKVRDYGDDWTVRDMNWYIVVAASTDYPFGTLIMTTLWPGRVYDRWGKVNGNHIDVFTHWEV